MRGAKAGVSPLRRSPPCKKYEYHVQLDFGVLKKIVLVLAFIVESLRYDQSKCCALSASEGINITSQGLQGGFAGGRERAKYPINPGRHEKLMLTDCVY